MAKLSRIICKTLCFYDRILRLGECDESERIRAITKRPFDKLRVTKEKGSRIQGAESKSWKFKVGSSKLEVQKSNSPKVQGSSYKLEPAECYQKLTTEIPKAFAPEAIM